VISDPDIWRLASFLATKSAMGIEGERGPRESLVKSTGANPRTPEYDDTLPAASRFWSAGEEEREDVDRIGEVHLIVAVRVKKLVVTVVEDCTLFVAGQSRGVGLEEMPKQTNSIG
jgi:hypothetical protein